MSDNYRDKLATIAYHGTRMVDSDKLQVKVVKQPGRRGGSMGAIVVSTGDPIEDRDLSQMAVEKSEEKAKEATNNVSKIKCWSDSKETYLERV